MKRTSTRFLLGLGLLVGSPSAWAQTQPAANQAFQFAGTATSVVKVANFGNPAADFSIEAWARLDAGGAGEDDIVSTHENPGTRRGYFIEYAHAGGNTPGLRAGIAGTSGNFVSAQYSAANWQPNQWHHVVMTYSAATKTIRLYQDGVAVASNTLAAGETPVYSARPVAIGGSDNYSGNAFKGGIDEVKFWDRELTATEIEANAHLLGATTGTGLKAYYSFNTLGANNAVANQAGTGLAGTAGAGLTASSVVASYAPIEQAPIAGLSYKANWAGKNTASNGGLEVVSTYTTEPVYVLHGRTAATGITATGVPTTVQRRLQRAWRVEKQGTTALMQNTLKFSLSDLGLIPGTTGPVYLLRSTNNTTYARIGAAVDSGTVANGVVSFQVADTTQAYLTLGFGRTPQLDAALVAQGSAWKYLDNGSNQGTAWTAAAFNDATWASGNAELGYGDGNEATVVSYGPSSSNKYVTTYFRRNFTANSLAGVGSVKLRLKRDDGAVVYLNGVEVHRSNMPAGPITYTTFASATVDGANESAFFEAYLPTSALTTGANVIAVEIHQDRASSSDISFDLELLKDTTPLLTCDPLPANFLSNFTSVQPGAQQQDMRIPATHTFQLLMQSGEAYSNPADGLTKESNDFTGYVPIAGSSTNGYLSVNHEGSSAATSGVSMLNLNFNATSKLWNVTAKNAVNFAPVVGTYNNCSGGVTPWNTVVTCEENTPTAPTDSNGDGYLDFGWNVEIDPATHAVKDQNGDGTPDKLWRMGRMRHENVVVAPDRRTVYEGADDGGTSYVYKYVATTPGNLSAGTLYVLKLDGAGLGSATTGSWIQVPNTTPAECNNTTAAATALGATSFNGVEDVEISPLTGQIYFTSKGNGRVYRFTDGAAAITSFEEFVGGQNYSINYGASTISEAWGSGNDNLTFDSQGNLYVLQDGGRNHIWMVRPCHTQANPAVEVFMVTPTGSEPTGMTLSPDEKFMFVSLQHPSTANTLATTDAAGRSVVFNKSSTLVIARKGDLGTPLAVVDTKDASAKVDVYPNPTSANLTVQLQHDRAEAGTLQVISSTGRRVLERPVTLKAGLNQVPVSVNGLGAGHYTLLIKTARTTISRPFIKQ